MTLRHKFILFTALAAVLFSVTIVYDRVYTVRAAMLARAQDRADYTCSAIGELAGERMARGDTARLKEIMQSFGNFKQIAYLRLFDAHGKLVYRHAAPGVRLHDRLPDRGITEVEDGVFDVVRDITYDGENLGTLQAGFSLEKIHEATDKLMWRGIVLSLLFISVITGVVWALTRKLGRDLEKILELTSKVETGNLSSYNGLAPGSDTAKIAGALGELSSRLAVEEERRRLAEAQKDEFFSMTVHDLKQPVTALKASLDLLLSEEEAKDFTPDQLQSLAGIARKSLNMLTSMIADVLNTARLNDPSFQPAKERVPLNELMQECAGENAPAVNAAGRVWRFEHPRETAGAWIFADRDIIKRVIGNLVLNAVQYTPEGGTIKLGLEFRGPEKAAIYVSDEGAGIPENFREEIFRKYSTMGKSSKNIGLGLAFCKLAAERHSAVLDVNSEMGKGTRFSFILPVSRNPEKKN